MSKRNGKPSKTDAREVMETLSQSDIAWLLSRSPSWVREQAHKFQRVGGKYDARQAIQSLQGDYKPAKLSSELQEIANLFADDLTVSSNQAAANFLESVEQVHGAAGLAAVAKQIIAELRNRGSRWELTPATDDEIEKRIQRDVENRTKLILQSQYKCLVTCGLCGAFRWGDSWVKDKIPNGFVAEAEDQDICPRCDKSRGGRKRKRQSEEV